MSTQGARTTNVADGSASVGFQAGTVHNVNYYYLPPDASPKQRFDVGLRYLRGGMPAEARECIGEAVAQGYVTSRSCFYLVLALLSGRTAQQMAQGDFEMLRSLQGRLTGHDSDGWTDAIRSIMRLVGSLETPQEDPRVLIKELAELGAEQRDEIARHLEIFLRGPIQDWIWRRAFDQARREQTVGDRTDRVWRFFQPEPVRPRVRWPHLDPPSLPTWARCVVATTIFVAATGYVIQIAMVRDWVSMAPVVLLIAGASIAAAQFGASWRYRTLRLRARDRALLPTRLRSTPPPGEGFAREIDQMFTHYFATYLPVGLGREEWLAETSGVRRSLRDEIVELYREQRIGAKRVAWLIRYLASDIRTRWRQDRLWSYRDELRVPAWMVALFLAAVAVLGVGVVLLLLEAAMAEPLPASGAAIIGLAAGWSAARDWLGIVLERWRFADEMAEAQQLQDDRMAAYERWCRKLRRKPTDVEMARWLDCDRRVLMERAVRHYKLPPRNIIAHAFIEAPAPGSKRARLRGGPLRYSKYRLLIFLLTADGVRQVSVELDFEKATFHNQDRLNYRYDAVAAVEVSEADDGHRTFELSLVNSHSIEAEVITPSSHLAVSADDYHTMSRVTLDAAGLGNTLHVLEGIAAEGKDWIHHERLREEDPLGRLADAVQGIVERDEAHAQTAS